MAKKVEVNTTIIGCGRWVAGGGGCTLPAGHGGKCVSIAGPGAVKRGKR
jgi:hypothetical protein